MENIIQEKFNSLINSIYDKDSFIVAYDLLESLKKITNLEPVFNAEIIRKIYLDKVLGGQCEVVPLIKELTNINPTFELSEKLIRNMYVDRLTNFNPDYFKAEIELIKNTIKITGIEPNFSDGDIRSIFSYANQRLKQEEKLNEILRLEEIFPTKGLLTEMMGEILLDAIKYESKETLILALDKMKQFKINFSQEVITNLVRIQINEDPKKIIRLVSFLKEVSKEDENVFLLQKTVSQNSWVKAILKIEKIQAIADNIANDPWENEFNPFLKYAIGTGVISLESDEDSERVVSFIEMMGMHNLPLLFSVYVDCGKHKDPEGLSSSTLRLFQNFGIKVRDKDGNLRYKSSFEIFNELSKALKGMQTSLLQDKIPEYLETNLGLELFDRLKGQTQFERKAHSTADVIKAWRKTIEYSPELAELPPGFHESTMKIPVLAPRAEATKDQQLELDNLLASQEVNDVYLPLAEALQYADAYTVEHFFHNIIYRFTEEEAQISELLAKSKEEIDEMIQNETDAKLKQNLIKKAKALQNPKGRNAIENQTKILKRILKEIEIIKDDVENDDDWDSAYVGALEALNRISDKVSINSEMRELSALHMYRTVMTDNWRELVSNLFDEEGTNPTVDKIYGTHKIAKDYIEEHYLHHLQNPEHTEHAAFSPELLEKLNLVWQQQLDRQTGHLPITFLKNKLDKVLGVSSETSRKVIPVTLTPVSGLFHIYSGDLGDSCHTSQHIKMASGNFPNLRTWVYSTNRGRPNEELRGSVLAILAEEYRYGIPTLIVRANNPSENFVQTVDADAFVLETLKTVIETAKRSREERIKEDASLPSSKKRQIVTIPMDYRGFASTNRQDINDVYRKRFIHCKTVRLISTPETNFNDQYPIWDDSGNMPSVIIWQMNEDGNEEWFGNWKLT